MRDSVQNLAEQIEDILASELPLKKDAYVAYNVEGNHFYVSTTDEDEYDGRISFDAVIQDFIDSYVKGSSGIIGHYDGESFARRLDHAASKIRALTEDAPMKDKE